MRRSGCRGGREEACFARFTDYTTDGRVITISLSVCVAPSAFRVVCIPCRLWRPPCARWYTVPQYLPRATTATTFVPYAGTGVIDVFFFLFLHFSSCFYVFISVSVKIFGLSVPSPPIRPRPHSLA